MSQPEREHIYAALVSVRNAELSAYWTRYNIQAVLNVGFIVAVLTARPDSRLLSPLPSWVWVGGIILSVIWLCFAIWGKRLFTDRWECYLQEYERQMASTLQMFTHVREYEKSLCRLERNWNNLNILARSIPVLALVAWIFIACSNPKTGSLEARISQVEENVAQLKGLEGDVREIRDSLRKLAKPPIR